MIDIRTSKIGQEFTIEELKQQCKMICGGVCWPGKRPGFAVVLGMSHDKHFDNHDIYLLDEFENMDMWELIKQCGVLIQKYQPTMWIGDRKNDAADRFIRELNATFKRPEMPYLKQLYLSVCWTPILDMKNPYPYIMSEIKKLVDKKRRQLVLKDSKTKNYLGDIEPSDVADLQLGDYPAIEAMAFAVIELRRHGQQSSVPEWLRRRKEPPLSPMSF
ncbi:MAG: hypothetical protein H8D56_05635 [Planctomycetes bacterium]|nr:hypothetical protein [Planctomycetota bacterium]